MQLKETDRFDLAELKIWPYIKEALNSAGFQYLDEVANLTVPKIQTICDTDEKDAKALLLKLDFFLDRYFHSKLLCPGLPPTCYELGIDTLELADNIVEALESAKIESLEDLAFAEQGQLSELSGLNRLLELDIEFAMSSFVDAYRNEDIIIEEEEE